MSRNDVLHRRGMDLGSLPSVRAALVASSVIGLGGTVIACNKSVCGDAEDCPGFEVETTEDDAKFSWDSMSTLAVSFEKAINPARVTGGGAVLEPADPGCSVDCGYTLKSLHVELEPIVLTKPNSSTIRVESLHIGLDPKSSVSLLAEKGEYSIPAGTKTLACARVDDDPLSTESELPSAATLVIDPDSETFAFEGELRFEFRTMPNRNCVDHEVSLSGTIFGAVPAEPAAGGGGEGSDPGAD